LRSNFLDSCRFAAEVHLIATRSRGSRSSLTEGIKKGGETALSLIRKFIIIGQRRRLAAMTCAAD